MGNIDNMTHRFDFFAHVVILVFHFKHDVLFTMDALEFIYDGRKKGFTCLEFLAVEVTNDILKLAEFRCAFYGAKVVEAIITVCEFWSFLSRESKVERHSDFCGMNHFSFGSTRMYIDAVNRDFG
ncbi:hypothetical protein D3C71_1684820 [compost metagenome]